MPDIFLSYNREDAAVAKLFAEAFAREGFEVWWDATLRSGEDYDKVTEAALRAAKAVVVLWSPRSAESRWVRIEATIAERNGTLMPVTIESCDRPIMFELKQTVDLSHWRGARNDKAWRTFLAHVQRMVVEGAERAAEAPSDASRGPAGESRRFWRSGRNRIAAAVAAALLIIGAGIAYMFMQPTVQAAEKSIAVLPFTNMSDNKENAFFADGVHEEVLTNLANIGDLRVVSRTSVMQYRDTAKTIPEIAREMGVAYVLEGSVRRAGNTVRVTAQLIKAGIEGHVWAKSYDRDPKDVFAIQSALAVEIADTLRAVLSPGDKARLQRAPTTSAAAYDLYLRAVEIRNRDGQSLDGYNRAQSLLQSAVELDPKFATAWGELAAVHLGIVQWSYDPTGGHLEKARQASETMERLAPDDPDTWIQLANYYAARTNFNRSEQYIRRAVAALPNNSRVVVQLGHLDRRQGRLADALSHYRKAYALDRQNPETRGSLGSWLLATRRYDEAAQLERMDPRDDGATLALLSFYARGSTREMEAWLAAHPSYSTDALMVWKFMTGDAAGFIRLADEARRSQPSGFMNAFREGQYGCALMALHKADRAKDTWEKNLARIRAAPPLGFAGVPVMLAFLGDKTAALAAFAEFKAVREKQAVNRDFVADNAAWPVILAWVGERDRALAELARQLKLPTGGNVHVLRRSPHWLPLQGDPRFEALLNDPANNAPLL